MTNPVTPAELIAMAERVEARSGVDDWLDGEVHKLLVGGPAVVTLPGGATSKSPYWPSGEGQWMTGPIALTSAVEAAEMALPYEGGYPEWQIKRSMPTGYHAAIATGAYGVGCETPALALLGAALRYRAGLIGEAP